MSLLILQALDGQADEPCLFPLPTHPSSAQMMLDGHVYLNIDAAHIQQSSPRLLTATIEVPDDLLNLWELQLNK